jgi:hypothetical protein
MVPVIYALVNKRKYSQEKKKNSRARNKPVLSLAGAATAVSTCPGGLGSVGVVVVALK